LLYRRIIVARAKKKDNVEELCFEEALEKLETIVKQLERGELSLDESLGNFAVGVNLSKVCLHKLDSAQQYIDTILTEERGKITEKPLQVEEDGSC
jgi:exodeoxyribonuclease VII small subunit